MAKNVTRPEGWKWAVERQDLWQDAESAKENDPPLEGPFRALVEFRKLIKQIPTETRQALTELWLANRNQESDYDAGGNPVGRDSL